MSYELTQEQKDIIEFIKSGEDLKVIAVAGAAKTTTLVEAAKECVTPILYLTFNKNMADEAKEMFPPWVEVRTTHSLAYAAVGASYKNKLKRPVGGYRNVCGTASEVAKYFKISPIQVEEDSWITSNAIGGAVLKTVRRFEYSSEEVIGKEHISYNGLDKFLKGGKSPKDCVGDVALKKYLDVVLSTAKLLWKLRIDLKSNILITHDTYMKLYQLSNPDLSNYTMVMLDEAHDSNLCVVDIINRQTIQKVVVGDPRQQIYSWRGSVNALDLFDFEVKTLTKSFRYGQSVADVARAVTGNNEIYGWEQLATTAEYYEDSGEEPDNITLIFRTNAAMLQEAVRRITDGYKVNIQVDVKDFISLIESTLALHQGDIKKVKHSDLIAYESWEELIKDKDWVGADLSRVITMIENRSVYSVLGALRTHKNHSDPDVTFITAHRSKGLAFDHVILGDDFPQIKGGEAKGNVEEETNILYVAATRARMSLVYNDSVESFIQHKHEMECEVL